MGDLTIRVAEPEVMRLRRILMDEDATEALAFLKRHCEPVLAASDRPHCVPVFEANYGPRQHMQHERGKGRAGGDRT
ncbi:MAG: hypothetical protein IBX62_00970 [Coriobacteriia bacterium]|nr:hypothetical protein [Coriobacteriia bacterium]